MYSIMPVITLQFKGLNIYSTRFYLDEKASKLPIFLGIIYKENLPLEEAISILVDTLRHKIFSIKN